MPTDMADATLQTKRSKRARLVSHLYDYTNNVAELRGYDTNRGLAAGTAAAMLGISLDKLDNKSSLSSAGFEYLDAEADLIDGVALSANAMQEDQAHFMDRFMDIMVRSAMPESAEAEDLQNRMNDPLRTRKPPLSIRVFVSNLKELSWKMGAFFKLQYGLVHLVTWRKPTKTLAFLVAYTCVCMWPHIVLALPLLVLLFGIILPGYLHRHPMDTPEIIPVKKRGQSFLQFLNSSKDTSLLTDFLEEHNETMDEYSLTHSTGSSLEIASSASRAERKPKLNKDAPDLPDRADKKDKRTLVKSQVSLLINMRDLQNLTGDVLKSISHSESILNDFTVFKDERVTTYIFYVVIFATSFVLFFGNFIPWRLCFILSGWSVLLLCHPNAKKYLGGLQSMQGKVDKKAKKSHDVSLENSTSFFEDFDRQDIIVDEPPEVRIVEVFELQTRDVFKQEWKFYAYSKRLFDYNDAVRVAGKLPHGVNHLNKVSPPKEWKFDFGFTNNWRIDPNPQELLKIRRYDQTHLRVPEDSGEGWIYDKVPVDQDTTQEFRRRRLYRTCYRYARPQKIYKLK
ncbi:Pex24p-domain-containing protein [Metschnikowia bicuspidata var. bicuspidata NRRL YB-4993]|uniref:Pex24p-domain-containing protein n=1 Tax=Metschnikowia bicuspidata var. bicuspidata NRRL YB-4993 TaxID=869754 RepID=A0A1A0H728_9ASCO|nr:Pex24p-domain-containing protein [Metschnikowia bicuspidata var. bicuspidata NRRL YB-4993]OBA19703.1 Pex24p-domain-containing protein [Metschnikowia bicuspidata var. bicuspidata NRRL YB-4993]